MRRPGALAGEAVLAALAAAASLIDIPPWRVLRTLGRRCELNPHGLGGQQTKPVQPLPRIAAVLNLRMTGDQRLVTLKLQLPTVSTHSLPEARHALEHLDLHLHRSVLVKQYRLCLFIQTAARLDEERVKVQLTS